ncbi:MULTISPECIES: hypothetical protein [Spirosoma]|uniref:Uncharacterized protein n=1 Tax=Spirosoma sordidisoli TaxID=2502893 RepID=A0A4Q2UKP8_9BACT|nr:MULTISPECIES: hypothetical protein [Spirosoma]RYC69796.1 hypothetical protein EQG79_14470 [Spirosoma sordidisoli]
MNNDLALTNLPSRFEDKFDRIVKYYRCQLPDTDPKKVKLSRDLAEQLSHWITIHALLSTGRYPKTSQQLNAILKAIPGISARTARNYLDDTRRFFAIQDQPNLAYERVMLIDEMRDDMRLAKKKGDLRSLAALRQIYIKLIGADKPEDPVENKTVINIINFNPEQLGGQQISDEQLTRMIDKMLALDKKKTEELFDDFEDVSSPQTPA